MRYTKIIALLAIMFVAVACVSHELDFDGGNIDTNTNTETTSDVITVYGNVARFADCEVSTRANKTPEESYVSKMALAVFPITNEETGETGDCIHYELRDGSNLLYTVDRAEISEKYGDEYENAPCVMYIFANMPGLPSSYNGSADSLLNLALGSTSLTRPDGGFPMIGSLGDINRDGKEFILMPMTGNRMDLPKVNDKPTDYLNIPMSAVFAKISFEIAVTPDQDVDVHAPSRFEMTGYEVHNLPSTVSFNDDLNKAEEEGEPRQPVNGEIVNVSMSGIAQGGNEGSGSIIEFDFYLPERLLTPDTSAEEYKYPLGDNGSQVTGYSNIPDDNKKYAQRYKPELLGDDQKATFIRIKGKYRDHHETYHNVSYDIYLGADNYGDFNIVRNNQYFNKLNIRGITSSDDQSLNDDAISIDHRVNVERSSPLIISLRRETQLDAHYEVRPLRLRIAGKEVPTGAKATVEVLNEDGTDNDIPGWIRLEASGNTEHHITSEGSSKGKRKYFTTNLVTETLADGTKVEVTDLKTDANSTVWIYVDEADPTKATTTRSTRSATIRVTYYEDNEVVEVKDYHISQYNLHKIMGSESGRAYYIECFEEYLYNYDSEDSYGQIREEGMPWGLNGVQLSHIHDSFICNETNGDWTSFIQKNPIKYDFYIGKHDDDNESSDEKTKDGGTLHNFAGQEFTKEIAEYENSSVTYPTLDRQASSAVEYCYSRNKRNPDGTVDVKWYLPSADELEDFIVPAYSTFEEFQDNYYWTSQPAYIRNAFYYEYHNGSRSSNAEDTYVFVTYEDNKTHARATKVGYNNSKYDYVPSGLNKEPEETHAMDQGCIDQNEIDTENYFNVMYAWYRWEEGLLWWKETRTEEKTWTVDTHFKERKDGRDTGNRYHIHLGHLNDLIQKTEDGEHGYHERTKSNRVRCVRKM